MQGSLLNTDTKTSTGSSICGHLSFQYVLLDLIIDDVGVAGGFWWQLAYTDVVFHLLKQLSSNREFLSCGILPWSR